VRPQCNEELKEEQGEVAPFKTSRAPLWERILSIKRALG